jgi:hypothetical protein
MDSSQLLDQEGITVYQSMVGSMQWAVSLARLDIASAVMTLSSFRAAPRVGHLERANESTDTCPSSATQLLRFRTKEPDYSDLPEQNFDWMYTVYGNVQEVLPHDAPEPLGKPVRMTH